MLVATVQLCVLGAFSLILDPKVMLVIVAFDTDAPTDMPVPAATAIVVVSTLGIVSASTVMSLQ